MIEIGKILKAHGIRGGLKARLFSDNFSGFEERGYAYADAAGETRIEYTVERIDPPYMFIRIKGVETRNDAEKYEGVFLYLDRSELEELPEGEYYIADLIGLEVMDGEGGRLGRITDVLQHGAADVYVVKGERDFMFPALKRVIRDVDVKKGVMTVDAKALEEVAVYD